MEALTLHEANHHPSLFSLWSWVCPGTIILGCELCKEMCCSVTTGLVGGERGEEEGKGGALQGAGCPAHQIRIGPVALQGRGDFANNQVVHLLGGFWIVSGEAEEQSCYSPLVVSLLFTGSPE